MGRRKGEILTTPKAVPTVQSIDVQIDKVKVGERMRSLDMVKVSELADSINQIGLINPITVDRDYRLIAGRHRLEACKLLGWMTIPAIILGGDELAAELAEIDENLVRNELTALEQGEHLLRRDEILEEMGQRAKVGDNQHQSGSEESSPPQTTSDIAKQVGLSERIAQQRKQVVRNLAPGVRAMIHGTPLADEKTSLLRLSQLDVEKQGQLMEMRGVGDVLRAGEMSVSQAKRELKHRAQTPPEPIEGIYRVWYADPPWQYGNSGIINDTTDNYGRAERHYPTMSIDELCAMGAEIKAHCEDNAVLFLWVTLPMLFDAHEVVRAWGFDYKTAMVWDKVRHNFGHYVSVRSELLLICVRGSCTPDIRKLFDNVITEERTSNHSEKPLAFREIIETLYPNGNRIELFARKPSDGWDVWGNEVKS